MPINLSKGQKVSLTKENPSLSRIMVGLGWDVNEFDVHPLQHIRIVDVGCNEPIRRLTDHTEPQPLVVMKNM